MGIGARFARLSLAILLLPWVTVAASELPREVEVLAEVHAKTPVLAGAFRWLTDNPDSGERERIGDFHLVRSADGMPPKYNVNTSAPDGSDQLRWCSDGTQRWQIERIVPEEPPTVRVLRPEARDADLDRIVAGMLLDLPALARDFAISLEGTGDSRRLVFTPLTPELRQEVTRMVVQMSGDDPKEVIIESVNNPRIRLVVTRLRRDTQEPAEFFFRPVPREGDTSR